MSASLPNKICEQCGEGYYANQHAFTRQKYCQRLCKERASTQRAKEAGTIRKRKGGYNRTIYITKFLDARHSDQTAPCHYCQKRLEPDSEDWVLDHIVPLSECEIGSEQEPTNLCLSCKQCNIEKNTQDYEIFKAKKQKEIHG